MRGQMHFLQSNGRREGRCDNLWNAVMRGLQRDAEVVRCFVRILVSARVIEAVKICEVLSRQIVRKTKPGLWEGPVLLEGNFVRIGYISVGVTKK